jgi:outer membrane immunogenic protein
MKMKGLTIAALAAAVSTHAAYAQDPEPTHAGRDAAAVPGFRVEVLGGFDTDGYQNGALYGGRIGYDFKVGRRFLLGVDGEFSDVTTDQELTLSATAGLTAEDGPEYYVGGRATFVLSREFRLYGGGGYTRTKEGYFFQSDPNPPPFGTAAAGRDSFEGLRVTAGAQILLGRRAFIGAEYRYSNYGGPFARDREQAVASVGLRF